VVTLLIFSLKISWNDKPAGQARRHQIGAAPAR